MNTTNGHNGHNNANALEPLRYESLFSNQKFEIDSKDNLHITEQSALKSHNEVVPLDLINPQPTSDKHLNKPLMLLALASALASSAFFASAILMGQLWAVAFGIVFWVFGMGTLFTSYKNGTTDYKYKFANSEAFLFSLSQPSSQNKQVELFIHALNERIINLNENNEQSSSADKVESNGEILDISDEKEVYMRSKKSQYMKHLDFLFNHGIVDEVLYKKLDKTINNRISDSENRFMTNDSDIFEGQTVPNNIINFPVNA